MKYILGFILFGCFYSSAFAQPTICLGNDSSICQGEKIKINQCEIGSNILFLDNPIQVNLRQDNFSAPIDIGFDFNYFGGTFKKILIGEKGQVSFNIKNTFSSFTATKLPKRTSSWIDENGKLQIDDITNTISLAWHDLVSANGGKIYYQTIGSAPNRKFVVSYENLKYFSFNNTICTGPTYCFTGSLILNESSNNIEMYIGSKNFCIDHLGGIATQGVQDSSATYATVTPGRDSSNWVATNEGKLYSPDGSTNYSISDIPFVTVTSKNSNNILWTGTNGFTYPYVYGEPLILNSLPDGTTGYYLSTSSCGISVESISDTTFITRKNAEISTTVTPDICGGGVGTATTTIVSGTAPFSFNWSNGATTQDVTNLTSGTYKLIMTTADMCTATQTVTVESSTIPFTTSNTPVSCHSGADGTASVIINSSVATFTYLWDDPSAQTTATATGLKAGSYLCKISSNLGCSEKTRFIITEVPGMNAIISKKSNLTCNSANDGSVTVNVSDGTPPYSYNWINSSATTNIATDLKAGGQKVTITDAKGCKLDLTTTLSEPNPLSISFVTPDTTICPQSTLNLKITAQGGSSPYTYDWTKDDISIGSQNTLLVNPEIKDTLYCITLGEECGSPSVNSCIKVKFTDSIVPKLTPSTLEACAPEIIFFKNETSPTENIVSTLINFGNGEEFSSVELFDTVSTNYKSDGLYSVSMIVKSTLNCIYTTVFPNLILIKPSPKAEFEFKSNPVRMFESEVKIWNRSSDDVTNYVWTSSSSSPSQSTIENPTFKFPDNIVGNYPITLKVSNSFDCYDSITKVLNIISDILFYAPNAFTPVKDLHNQTWKVYADGIDINEYELSIFDRWGEMIWKTTDVYSEWDGKYKGKDLPPGTYIWTAVVRDATNYEKKSFNGYITLIR